MNTVTVLHFLSDDSPAVARCGAPVGPDDMAFNSTAARVAPELEDRLCEACLEQSEGEQ